MPVTDKDLTTSQLSRDDQLLIARLQAGDRKAIAAIERAYGDELRLFCRRMTGDPALAEDLVQDVLAVCCRLEAGSLPTRSIRGWLYQLCRHRCIDALRKRHGSAPAAARATRRVQPSYEQAIDPLTTPSGKALKRDRATKILAVLQELDDDLRSVVVMRYLQGLPREEIAEAIGLSIAGTKARLRKAMQVMREKLRKLDDSALR